MLTSSGFSAASRPKRRPTDASIQPDRLASAIFADLVLGALLAFCIGALTTPVGVSGAVEQAQAEGATA
jgi:hypothetical protein